MTKAKIVKTLFILDLDHTVIFGSYAAQETASLLFKYNAYLKVYKRPFAIKLIELCKSKGDIIIFTTALKDYALQISKHLNIEPLELLSRKNCSKKNDQYTKHIKNEWITKYNDIVVIDDSPNVWRNIEYPNISFLVPKEFRGDKEDRELEKIIQLIRNI